MNKSNIDELSVLNDYKDIIIEMERYTRISGSNFIIVYITKLHKEVAKIFTKFAVIGLILFSL